MRNKCRGRRHRQLWDRIEGGALAGALLALEETRVEREGRERKRVWVPTVSGLQVTVIAGNRNEGKKAQNLSCRDCSFVRSVVMVLELS